MQVLNLMQFASGGAFKFSTGGTERVRINNFENVGIGTCYDEKLQFKFLQ